MKAQRLEPNFYEIQDGSKWYTASLREDGMWFVMNHQGRVIREGSAIYHRVEAAVTDAIIAGR